MDKLFLIKVELQYCHVEVNREFCVPADIRLDKLHDVIQKVMGWHNSHMHMFLTSKGEYGVKDDDTESEKTMLLSDIVTAEEPVFYYEYDFGDSWDHILEVTSFDYTNNEEKPIHCISAQGACPPEDVGGGQGYEDFCQVLLKPEHPEYLEILDWVNYGQNETLPWPNRVSLDDINETLHKIKYKPLRRTKKSSSKKVKSSTNLGGKYLPYENQMVFIENEELHKILSLPETEIYDAMQKIAKEKVDAGLGQPIDEF